MFKTPLNEITNGKAFNLQGVQNVQYYVRCTAVRLYNCLTTWHVESALLFEPRIKPTRRSKY